MPREELLQANRPSPWRKAVRARSILRLIVAFAASLAVWWGVQRLFVARPRDGLIRYQMLQPIWMMGLTLCVVVWHEFRYIRPRKTLIELSKEVRAGAMPIESIVRTRGAMGPLAEELHEVFHLLRTSEKKIAELEFDMSRRVQSRTEAMERTIGGLKSQATRDPLTGLLNRRAMDEILPRLIEQARSQREDLALLMIDVDNFKQLNDQLGHAAGDNALRSIAQIIRSASHRDRDTSFRCGGDEFVMVLPGCPAEPAMEIVARLTQLVTALARTIDSTPPVALSIGRCNVIELATPLPAELLREADRRLYAVKAARKRKVRVA